MTLCPIRSLLPFLGKGNRNSHSTGGWGGTRSGKQPDHPRPPTPTHSRSRPELAWCPGRGGHSQLLALSHGWRLGLLARPLPPWGFVETTLACLVIFIGLSHQSVVLGGPKVGCQCYLESSLEKGSCHKPPRDVIESQVVPSLTPLL